MSGQMSGQVVDSLSTRDRLASGQAVCPLCEPVTPRVFGGRHRYRRWSSAVAAKQRASNSAKHRRVEEGINTPGALPSSLRLRSPLDSSSTASGELTVALVLAACLLTELYSDADNANDNDDCCPW